MTWFWVSDTDKYGNSIDLLSGMEIRLTDAWRDVMIESLEVWLNDQDCWRQYFLDSFWKDKESI